MKPGRFSAQYLGPDELLVAAEIGLVANLSVAQVAAEIDAAEQRIRGQVPAARLIYLEPDLDRGARAQQLIHLG